MIRADEERDGRSCEEEEEKMLLQIWMCLSCSRSDLTCTTEQAECVAPCRLYTHSHKYTHTCKHTSTPCLPALHSSSLRHSKQHENNYVPLQAAVGTTCSSEPDKIHLHVFVVIKKKHFYFILFHFHFFISHTEEALLIQLTLLFHHICYMVYLFTKVVPPYH